MSKVRLATIGNGMVGRRFIESLLDKSDAASSDITVFREEPCTTYDHVYLSSYFSHRTAEELSLTHEGFYEKRGTKVLVGECVITINRQEKAIHPSAGRIVFYDRLIMVTGSYPWIPPIKGSDTQDCFVHRTIEDLSAIESYARRSKRDAVAGGGLLGLEAAGALKNLGIETHVIGFVPILMAEQFDQIGGEQLRRKIESMGVRVYTSKSTLEIVQEGVKVRKTMCLVDGSELEADSIVFSTGIHPCDELATQCGLGVAPRGGAVIDNPCQTSDPNVYVISECVSWNGRVFDLVAPGHKMMQVVVDHILGNESAFEGTDLSAELKLLSIGVGGIGDAHGRMPDARGYVYLDENKGTYKHLIVSKDNETLLSAVPTGDTSDYGNLLQLVLNAIELPENPDSLILPARSGSDKPSIGVDKLPGSAQICSCFDVTKDGLTTAINEGCRTAAALKTETRAGTGCGGCIPPVTRVLNTELAKQDIEVNNNLCEHFTYSRQELFHLIRVEDIKTLEELLTKYGKGYDREVCKPTVDSLLASCWSEYILKPEHTPPQDPNDNLLASIQKGDTCSAIPRSPGGEIAPEGLMAAGCIACEFNLYIKTTGSQRLAMFGAWRDDLPEIRYQLTEAGFETGHAYAKALRMAKICVGSTWCYYGVGDSVGPGVELENRYKDIRMPHRMKFGVSGCTRERSEAQGKDVDIIATEKNWDLYVCGNGDMEPRHAGLLAADTDRETLIKYLDRFTMFYVHTADKLARTAPWSENFEGGIDYLKVAIIDDKLGLNAHLEEEMTRLCEVVLCEWAETVNTPSAQTHFEHFTNNDKRDSNMQIMPEREQYRPATSYECIPVTLVEDNA